MSPSGHAPSCLTSRAMNLRRFRRLEPSMIRSALMTVMTNAAIKAGRGLKRDFGEVGKLQVSMKGTGRFRQPRRQARGKDAVRGACQGPAGLRLRHGGERTRRGNRQEPHLAYRPARRDDQLPARNPDFRHLDRARARRADRRRRHLQSRRRRHVRHRKGPGRVRRQPPPARRRAHGTCRRRCSAAAFPISARRRSIRGSRRSWPR